MIQELLCYSIIEKLLHTMHNFCTFREKWVDLKEKLPKTKEKRLEVGE